MQNLILHISLPQGIRLQTGPTLMKDVTFDFISQITPYYSTIDMVKLSAGPSVKKLTDITIGCQIYQSSQEADLISPIRPPSFGWESKLFTGARMQWVTAHAAKMLLLNIISLLGPTSHVLANFSVERKADNTKRLGELEDSLKLYDPTIRSGGRVMPGGRPHFGMAAKGVFDWTEQTPGRNWLGNGMGANSTTVDMGSSTGGRGKPMKFFASPTYSPPFSCLRPGIYQNGFPMAYQPYPMGIL